MDVTKILLGTRSNLDGRVIIVAVVVTMTIDTLTTKTVTRLGSQVCSLFNPDVPKIFCDNFYDTIDSYKIIGIDMTKKWSPHQGIFIQISIKTPQLTNLTSKIFSTSQVPIPLGTDGDLYKFAFYENTPHFFANLFLRRINFRSVSDEIKSISISRLSNYCQLTFPFRLSINKKGVPHSC